MLLTSFQIGFALDPQDETAITATIDQYVDAWNNRSGRGFGDGFSVDCNVINIFGMHFHGREAVENGHIELLDTLLKDSIFIVTKLELKERSESVVMAFVSWKVEVDPGGKMEGIFSHIFTKDKGQWEITETQNKVVSFERDGVRLLHIKYDPSYN